MIGGKINNYNSYKCKIVPVSQHHSIKMYWKSGGNAPCSLDFTTDVGEWSVSCSYHFNPE